MNTLFRNFKISLKSFKHFPKKKEIHFNIFLFFLFRKLNLFPELIELSYYILLTVGLIEALQYKKSHIKHSDHISQKYKNTLLHSMCFKWKEYMSKNKVAINQMVERNRTAK